MDVLLAHQRAIEDDSKYIGSSFHGLDPLLRSKLQATFGAVLPPHPPAAGLQALLLCPTQARLEERLAALAHGARNQRDHASGGPSIRFAACRGPAPQAAHARLCQDPPQLLLTDAATLELWLMGWMGPAPRENLCADLRVLVMDGLEGGGSLRAAELALLGRRLQARCARPLMCIGSLERPTPFHPEPLLTHLYALAVAETGLAERLPWAHGRPGLHDLVDGSRHALPLRPDLRAVLRPGREECERIQAVFERSLHGVPLPRELQAGGSIDAWVMHALETWAARLDQALDRWRVLYRSALGTLEDATYKIQSELLSPRSAAFRCQQRRQEEGQQQLRVLRNADGDAAACSDFHPARFLAAEGLLPGHDVARRPVRLFLASARGPGVLVARPRTLALRDFGPLAFVHHAGRRYRVTQTVLPGAASALTEAKLGRASGCWLEGEQRRCEACPVTGQSLAEPGACEHLHDLLELTDARAEEVEDAVLEEGTQDPGGFDIESCFSVDEGSLHAVQQAALKLEGQTLFDLRFLPSARLVEISRRWSGSEDEGFPLDLLSGDWSASMPPVAVAPTWQHRRVRLWSALRTDVLMLTPASRLGLRREDTALLRQLLLRAVEHGLQAAVGELQAVSVGQGEARSILLYEAHGAGAGLLARLVDDQAWRAVMAQARTLYRADIAAAPTDGDPPCEPAPPRCGRIDSSPLGELLEQLHHAVLERPGRGAEESYEARYARLRQQLDPAAAASHRFLDHLHAQGLRLPDAVRRRVPGLYLQPDFHFAPRTWVFCDGGADEALAAEEHAALREALLARGDEVWAWHAAEELAAKVAQRPDLFGPAR